MNKNAINWFEIPAADLSRAKKFYEAILGFELQSMEFPNGLKMEAFPSDRNGGVGGALCHYPDFYKPNTEGALVYLNGNPDLSNVLDKVEDNGGKIMVPKTQIAPDIGYMGVFQDSEGNRIALHSEA